MSTITNFLLNKSVLQDALRVRDFTTPCQIDILDTLDSTHIFLKNAIMHAPIHIVGAHIQTQGYGRRGKTWDSSVLGNLYVSVGMHLAGKINRYTGMSLVTALSAARVLGQYIPCMVQWPNDILCNGSKIGGIIIEPHPHSPHYWLIGIGLNINASQKVSWKGRYSTSLYLETGVLYDCNDILAYLVQSIDNAISDLYLHGFLYFMEDWKQHDALYGQSFTCRLDTGDSIMGVGQGVNAQGLLCIQDIYGRTYAFSAAEIYRTYGKS